MKRIFAFLIIILFGIQNTSFPQDNNFGLGIMVGSPTGISAKYWVSGTNAIDFGLGYSFSKRGGRLHIHADYVWHNFDLIKSSERIPIYYGVGGRFKVRENEDGSLGVRGVIGINWLSSSIPLDVFLEVAPVFRIFPATSLDFDAAIGARFWFR